MKPSGNANRELADSTGIFLPTAFAQPTAAPRLEFAMALDLSQYVNVDPRLSSGERVLSILIGLGLTSVAAQPRSNVFLSMLALASGSYLAYRGATGFCVIKESLNDSTAIEHKPA